MKKKVDIMLPVYYGNLEEIEPSINKQIKLFSKSLKEYDWGIVLAINGKNPEKIIELVKKLNKKDSRVGYDYVEQAGKGSGVIHSWLESKADIVCYMDIDLATDIRDFPNLISQIEKGYDLSVGSRYNPNSIIKRGFKRKFVSIVYHKFFIKLFMGIKNYTDLQCGFKAVNQRVIKELLPLVENKNWFFESELLYFAEKKKFRGKEIPVRWTESEFSGLSLYKAILEFLECSFRLKFRRIS